MVFISYIQLHEMQSCPKGIDVVLSKLMNLLGLTLEDQFEPRREYRLEGQLLLGRYLHPSAPLSPQVGLVETETLQQVDKLLELGLRYVTGQTFDSLASSCPNYIWNSLASRDYFNLSMPLMLITKLES
jgi:hypothetical protein